MNKTTLNSQKEKHSTLSLRRATRYAVNQFPVTLISIHALLAESDNADIDGAAAILGFLSTLSLRRATLFTIGLNRAHGISIHALLAESDFTCARRFKIVYNFYPRSPCGERHTNLRRHRGNNNFYPRSPCGERQHGNADDMYQYKFLSTLSLRRATQKRMYQLSPKAISIHALLAESDHAPSRHPCQHSNFYPRSPCGERRIYVSVVAYSYYISIHALLAESDCPLR